MASCCCALRLRQEIDRRRLHQMLIQKKVVHEPLRWQRGQHVPRQEGLGIKDTCAAGGSPRCECVPPRTGRRSPWKRLLWDSGPGLHPTAQTLEGFLRCLFSSLLEFPLHSLTWEFTACFIPRLNQVSVFCCQHLKRTNMQIRAQENT